jgi:hypothetical protein
LASVDVKQFFGSEAVEAVELADRFDGVELLRDRQEPRARLLPWELLLRGQVCAGA